MKVWFASVLAQYTPNYAVRHLRVYLDKPERKANGEIDGLWLFSVTQGDAGKLFPPFVANLTPEDEPVMGYLDVSFGYREESA